MYEETKIWISEELANCFSIEELEAKYKMLLSFIHDEYQECYQFIEKNKAGGQKNENIF